CQPSCILGKVVVSLIENVGPILWEMANEIFTMTVNSEGLQNTNVLHLVDIEVDQQVLSFINRDRFISTWNRVKRRYPLLSVGARIEESRVLWKSMTTVSERYRFRNSFWLV